MIGVSLNLDELIATLDELITTEVAKNLDQQLDRGLNRLS